METFFKSGTWIFNDKSHHHLIWWLCRGKVTPAAAAQCSHQERRAAASQTASRWVERDLNVNSVGKKKGIHNYSQLEWGAPQLCIFSRYLGPLRPGNWLADLKSQLGLEHLNTSQAGAGALPLAPRMAGFSSQELRLPPAAMLLSLSGTESGTFEERQKY